MRVFSAARSAALVVGACLSLSACGGASGLEPTAAPGIPPIAAGAAPALPPPPAEPASPSESESPAVEYVPASSPASPASGPSVDAGPPPDTRTGPGLDQPYTVDGIIIVSPHHLVSAKYKPPKQVGPSNVTPETQAAIESLQAGAHAAGLTAKVRSGYRSYATQETMLNAKSANYPDREAELRYIALPGASEHQTGLAVDFWDGRNWGNSIGNTPLMKWLSKHAREYGFVLRYPPEKEEITGYAYEAWHLRYVGTDVSLKFEPDSNLTLEEFLGLA